MFGSKHVQQQIQDIQDRAYDLFGEFILEKEATKLLSEIEAEGEEWTENEEFLKRCDVRCRRIIEKHCRKAQRRRFFTETLPHLGRIAAMMIVVVTVAGCTAFAASETVRVHLLQWMVQTTDEFTALSLEPSVADYVDVPAEWEGSCFPTYIPEGLNLVFADNNTLYYSYDGSLPAFVFVEYDDSTVAHIDTENAEVKSVTIHGQDGYISTAGSTIHLFWREGTRYFVLTFRGIAEPVALEVAESVTQIR